MQPVSGYARRFNEGWKVHVQEMLGENKVTKNEFNALPWHSVVLLIDKDRNNFAQALSGLREAGFVMQGQIFTRTIYEHGVPVVDELCQLLIKERT